MKIIFFNHFHRGDLFTHKEYARDLKMQLQEVEFEYWHYNHPKVNADLNIPLTNTPDKLDRNVLLYTTENKDTLFINTWIGVHGEIFGRCGGVNLNSLHESWGKIYQAVENMTGRSLVLKNNKFDYMPRIDYSVFNTSSVDKWVAKQTAPLVMICNGLAMSNQSFNYDMSSIIVDVARKTPTAKLICTTKFETDLQNVVFTDDIINDKDEWHIKPPWMDRQNNTCDLNEISYLSTFCKLIIGKNSGPFVFCETSQNYLREDASIISFSKGSQESMSHEVSEIECKYSLITDHDPENVAAIIRRAVSEL